MYSPEAVQQPVSQPVTKPKPDIVDYALVVGFMLILLTICYMSLRGQDVPILIQTMLGTFMSAIGFKMSLPGGR